MSRDDVKTVRLSVDEIMSPSWATCVAILERMGPQAVFALRLGLIEQAHRLLDEMAHIDSRAELVDKLRFVTDALAHMPWT